MSNLFARKNIFRIFTSIYSPCMLTDIYIKQIFKILIIHKQLLLKSLWDRQISSVLILHSNFSLCFIYCVSIVYERHVWSFHVNSTNGLHFSSLSFENIHIFCNIYQRSCFQQKVFWRNCWRGCHSCSLGKIIYFDLSLIHVFFCSQIFFLFATLASFHLSIKYSLEDAQEISTAVNVLNLSF